MEKVIIHQNKHWKGIKYPRILERTIIHRILKNLGLKEIQVVSGVRRSGKSTLFKLIINNLIDAYPPKSVLYINFDDPFFTYIWENASRIYEVIEIAEKLTGEKFTYLFLDEIQNVAFWQKFVKNIYDSELFRKIFITGSNSSLLQGEYANLLSGRYILDKVFPFSFKEILNHNSINDTIHLIERKPDVLRIVESMLEYGGYPQVVKTKGRELKRTLLLSYYETIVLKDCIARGKIRDIRTFRELAYYIISNCTSPFSYNSLARAITSNENTVKDFLALLEESFLVSEIRQFSYSIKEQTKGKRKIYSIDNGFPANISFRFMDNKGVLFENLVYSELLKHQGEIFLNSVNYECDFIIKHNNELTAIRACYDLTDRNMKREIDGLNSVKNNYNINKCLIITYNQEKTVDAFKVIPFWRYFF